MVLTILRSDGGVSLMRIFDPNPDQDVLAAQIQLEIAKWQNTMAGITAVSWRELTDAELAIDPQTKLKVPTLPRRWRNAWGMEQGVAGPIAPRLSEARKIRQAELAALAKDKGKPFDTAAFVAKAKGLADLETIPPELQ